MYFFEAVKKDTGVNINMTVASDQGASFPDWYAMIENELNNEPGAEVLYFGVLELGVHQCSVFMAVRNNGSYDVLTNNYVILYCGKAYMFNFTCPTFLYEEYQPIEGNIVGSLLIE